MKLLEIMGVRFFVGLMLMMFIISINWSLGSLGIDWAVLPVFSFEGLVAVCALLFAYQVALPLFFSLAGGALVSIPCFIWDITHDPASGLLHLVSTKYSTSAAGFLFGIAGGLLLWALVFEPIRKAHLRRDVNSSFYPDNRSR